MKKHVVMVVGEYYPGSAPAGKCAEKNISAVADLYDVQVVCTAGESSQGYVHNGKKIVPACTGYFLLQQKLRLSGKKVLYHIFKLPVYFLDLFRHPNNLFWYKNEAFKTLEKIHSENPIDIVFSVSGPMACHCAAEKFKKAHPEVKWVTYLADSYAAKNAGKKRAARFEKKVLSFADKNLLSEEIYNNCEFLKKGQEEKVSPLPYMIEQKEQTCEADKKILSDGKINLVYAGRFYKKIRNPKVLLETIVKLPDEFLLHLYCSSDCDSMIKKAAQMSGGKILLHNMVNEETLAEIYAEADILVNVENTAPEFAPSKTFEYIATGKPILNFTHKENKNALLEKHPACFNVYGEENVVKIVSFMRENAGLVLPAEKIKEIYFKHTPENIRKIILGAFEE